MYLQFVKRWFDSNGKKRKAREKKLSREKVELSFNKVYLIM